MQTASNGTKRDQFVLACRAVTALVACGLLVLLLVRVLRDVLGRAAAGAPLGADEPLVGFLAAVALVLTAWMAAGIVLVALATVPGVVGRAASAAGDVLAPRALRRVAAALLGLTVAAALAPGASVAAAGLRPAAVIALDRPDPAFAPLPDPGWRADTPAPGVGGGPDDTVSAPDPGWVPTAPMVRTQPDVRALSPGLRSDGGGQEPVEVVVRRGDTLWSIAARHLGPDPSESEVARAWPTWFAANRDVVGDDPDLLLPGQVLRVPEAVAP